MNSDQNNGCGFFIALIFGLTLLSSMFESCNKSPSSTYVPQNNTNSFEHRYAKERIKLEGYSDSEASKAADAIMKFHEAQKSRNR